MPVLNRTCKQHSNDAIWIRTTPEILSQNLSMHGNFKIMHHRILFEGPHTVHTKLKKK